MKVVIFTADSNGGYPVPAVKGGAVSTLVESLVKENNKKQLMNMTIVSLYDKEAKERSKEYSNIRFIWIRVPRIIKSFDDFIFWIVKTFFKKKKAISYKSVFSLIYYIHKSADILKKMTFDKVVLENNILIAQIIKISKYKGEYYYHFHNVPRINVGCQKIFDNCTGYFCVSDYVGNQIASDDNAIGPIPKEKISTLFNCINTELFKTLPDKKILKQHICEKYNIPTDNKILLFVGRLSKEKGIDKVLKALLRIKNRKNITLLIVGSLLHNIKVSDLYQTELHKLANKLGSNVVFTGYVSQDSMPEIYNVADVAILPSMWDEPAGLTMIEAMACGTPVITTESGGIPEYVSNYATVLKRDDLLEEKIALSIVNILKDDTLYREEGANRVKKLFSENYYVESFNNVLKK